MRDTIAFAAVAILGMSAAAGRRLLILAEGHSGDPHHGKTMRGVVDYGQDTVVAVVDSERAGETHKGIPIVASVAAAAGLGADTILVGVAPTGGKLPQRWKDILADGIRAGLAVESGLHDFVSDDAALVELAARHRVTLTDLRRPPADLGVPSGANLRVPATIVHTVGTDCAIGKMTVSLELDREARRRGLASPDDGDALALTFAYPVVPRSETDELRTEDLVRNLKRRVV